MGLKKKIKKLLGALEGVLEGPEYHKALKKERAFTQFIETLSARREALLAEIEDAPDEPSRREVQARLTLLDAQLDKAHAILATIQQHHHEEGG